MTSTTGHGTSTVGLPPTLDPKRWLALVVIGAAQLMIILDATIVSVALPSAQRDLGISDADRQWMITAYTVAFGGLLLLGGRIADFMGRKRMFVIGLLGFAAASGLGGLATNAGLLFGARALQGAFGALLAPAALSLITVTFTDQRGIAGRPPAAAARRLPARLPGRVLLGGDAPARRATGRHRADHREAGPAGRRTGACHRLTPQRQHGRRRP